MPRIAFPGWALALLFACTPLSGSFGGDLDTYRWPEFRGPTGDGIAVDAAAPPVRWSETENVVWKRETEGRGWSSPVVWEGTAWMTAATEDGHRMWALAIDLADGSELWRKDLFENDELQETHLTNSFASPTPVTDGQRLWVNFGSYGTACLDAQSGEVLWQRRDLPCNHFRGPGSSPILVGDRLIFHMDGFDLQYVVALDAATGRTAWKVDRDIAYGTDDGDVFKAFSTPLVIEVEGQRQLISPTSKAVLAYDPETGDELWRVTYDGFSATARPLWDGQTVYVNSGFGKTQLLAIDPRGSGDISETHVRWTNRTGIGSKTSQLIYDGLIYNIQDAGVATCIDASNGETLWQKRLGGSFSASPILAGGRLYLFDDHDGAAHVINPGRTFDRISQNSLDDGCMASPAPLGSRLLVRTRSALYLLGDE